MTRADRIWLKLMEYGARLGCHQMQSRSFSCCGYQFPLCARCTGVLLGQIIGIVLLVLGVHVPWAVIALCIGVMGADWLIQYLEIRESTNLRRLITGTLCGAALMIVYYEVLRFLVILAMRLAGL